MRKIKKINGWLIVRFNDREKRLYEGLIGSFGVIDAELYTGDLDLDRGAMEYDNAGTLEEAVELARGLESEEDIEDSAERFVLVTESGDGCTEEEINPQTMIAGFEGALESRIGSERHTETDEVTAAHELRGFKAALNRLGLIDEEEAQVPEDHFGQGKAPLPRGPEDLLAYVCDCVCKHRGGDQAALDEMCEGCQVNRLYEAAEAEELARREAALKTLTLLRGEIGKPWQTPLAAEINASNAQFFIQAMETTGFIGTAEAAGYRERVRQALDTAYRDRAERQDFLNAPAGLRVTSGKLWALGQRLLVRCPQNDCTIYRNVFLQAMELDDQRDRVRGHAALTLEREQNKLLRELEQMYLMCSAVRCYRAEAGKTAGGDDTTPGKWVTRYAATVGVALAGQIWDSEALQRHVGERIEVRETTRGVEARVPGGAWIGYLTPMGVSSTPSLPYQPDDKVKERLAALNSSGVRPYQPSDKAIERLLETEATREGRKP